MARSTRMVRVDPEAGHHHGRAGPIRQASSDDSGPAARPASRRAIRSGPMDISTLFSRAGAARRSRSCCALWEHRLLGCTSIVIGTLAGLRCA